MNNKVELQKLVEHFDANIDFYKDTKKAYNEHSCRIVLWLDPYLAIVCKAFPTNFTTFPDTSVISLNS